MNIKILVAAHKKYQMPIDDIYLPIHVGAKGKEAMGYQRDDEGDNISDTNPRLCELTAIYWGWKNLKADYIGLTHYRRHFSVNRNPFIKNKFLKVLRKKEAETLLVKYDLLVPKKRKYYVESIQSHFIHLPYSFEEDLNTLKKVIHDISPEYDGAFETVMNRTSAHMFNMFIMKKDYFDSYCSWLFPIIFEADKRIDTSNYTPMEARAVAYFGEFMLDIWMENNPINYKEISVLYMEKQDWFKKISSFIGRKFGLKDRFYAKR